MILCAHNGGTAFPIALNAAVLVVVTPSRTSGGNDWMTSPSRTVILRSGRLVTHCIPDFVVNDVDGCSDDRTWTAPTPGRESQRVSTTHDRPFDVIVNAGSSAGRMCRSRYPSPPKSSRRGNPIRPVTSSASPMDTQHGRCSSAGRRCGAREWYLRCVGAGGTTGTDPSRASRNARSLVCGTPNCSDLNFPVHV
jgi:hypothetical protein